MLINQYVRGNNQLIQIHKGKLNDMWLDTSFIKPKCFYTLQLKILDLVDLGSKFNNWSEGF